MNREQVVSRILLLLVSCALGLGISPESRAQVFYDWECDTDECSSGRNAFGGFIAFDPAVTTPGGTFMDGSGGRILDFFFESNIPGNDPGAGPWGLGGLAELHSIEDLSWTIGADGQTLDAFTTVSGNVQCGGQNAGDICFGDVQSPVVAGQALVVRGSAASVDDVGNAEFSGAWVRRVPEPTSLGLLLSTLGAATLLRRR